MPVEAVLPSVAIVLELICGPPTPNSGMLPLLPAMYLLAGSTAAGGTC